MSYWILSLPRADMEHCIRIGTFGMKRKYLLGRVKKGDGIACYVTKDYKIIGLGEVTSPYYMDDSDIFKSEGVFPDRIDIKAGTLSPELDFISIIDKLQFIKNLAYWTVYMRNGIVEIPEHDWKVINNAVKVGGAR